MNHTRLLEASKVTASSPTTDYWHTQEALQSRLSFPMLEVFQHTENLLVSENSPLKQGVSQNHLFDFGIQEYQDNSESSLYWYYLLEEQTGVTELRESPDRSHHLFF